MRGCAGGRSTLVHCGVLAAGDSWSLAAPNDFMTGSMGGGGGLVHYGSVAVGSPHSSASRPPSPSGKALGTRYKLEK